MKISPLSRAALLGIAVTAVPAAAAVANFTTNAPEMQPVAEAVARHVKTHATSPADTIAAFMNLREVRGELGQVMSEAREEIAAAKDGADAEAAILAIQADARAAAEEVLAQFRSSECVMDADAEEFSI